MFGNRGQQTGLVWGVIIMLVSVAIGGLIFSRLMTETEKQASDENESNLTIGENVAASVGEAGSTIFPLLILVVIITVFVAIIAVVRILG